MVAKVQPRAPVQAPPFTRLLARLAQADVPSAAPAVAGRLGQWVDWNRAVVLARALDGRPPGLDAIAAADVPSVDALAAECNRARAALVEAISAERGLNLPASVLPGYAPFRQYGLSMQRAMQAASGRLRGQLRDRVAAASPELARLAEVDAVMEQTLSPREHALLAGVPSMLEARFDHLRAAAAPPPDQTADAPSPAASSPGPWLALFRRDLKDVLLAELEVRFHPIEGLLAALRTS